ncbi:hypothetical protein [Nocardioides massiliensis]|uniref:Uncharacterized protein n=1 Tax=Nocardioides massiliensis TaxID=1325935 RepID=A0ABT9NLY5_9ACTN|nr:hypothetical protein [Nocardioides massiliensis]MDP9821055.1 hypothetical protein [Nocardioides massiliensis]
MIRIFTFFMFAPLALSLFGAFEDGAGLATIATNITEVVGIDAGHAFDLGGGRTLEDAFNSNVFSYTGPKF